MKEFIPSYQTSYTSGHINRTFLDWYVRAFRPAVYVEVGVLEGDTLFSVAESLEREQIPSYAVGIDPWQTSESHLLERNNAAYEKVKSEVLTRRDVNKFCNVQALRMLSFDLEENAPFVDLSAFYSPQKIDMLFIDGGHKYEQVVQNYNLFLPLMKEDGVMLFHDTYWVGKLGGPGRFMQEVSYSSPVLTFFHENGLGIVFGPKAFAKIPYVDKFKTEWIKHLEHKS